MNNNLTLVEQIIDYNFKNKDLLIEALTHSAYANSKGLKGYDRLEFLGDTIVDFTISEYLFKKYKDAQEGELTDMRKKLVSKGPLVECVNDLKLKDYLKIAKSSEISEKMISDIFESITAAIYIDGGMEKAKQFVINKLKPYVDKWLQKVDVIAKLEETCLNHKFIDVSREGPDHKPIFKVALIVDNNEVAIGVGFSKQEAKKNCAANFLKVSVENIL